MDWFTADTHFGHAAILKYTSRPWASVADMNEALIANWNAVVGQNDRVYHLGDFAFLNTTASLDLLARLKGRIHLIEGNHDRHRAAKVRERFVWVDAFAELKFPVLDGLRKFVLCHYPLLTWNKAKYGSFMLHGHSHGHMQANHSAARRMDVGVDCHPEYRPFSLDEVIAHMAAKGPLDAGPRPD